MNIHRYSHWYCILFCIVCSFRKINEHSLVPVGTTLVITAICCALI